MSDGAVEILQAMLRDDVAPGLRALGFTGSGTTLRPRDAEPHGFACLGVQRGRYNHASLSVVTINLMCLSAEERAAAQDSLRGRGLKVPAVPSPSEEYFAGWSQRIGFLAQPFHDHWWGIRGLRDRKPVTDDILSRVSAQALPQFTARIANAQPPPEGHDGISTGTCRWAGCPSGPSHDV